MLRGVAELRERSSLGLEASGDPIILSLSRETCIRHVCLPDCLLLLRKNTRSEPAFRLLLRPSATEAKQSSWLVLPRGHTPRAPGGVEVAETKQAWDLGVHEVPVRFWKLTILSIRIGLRIQSRMTPQWGSYGMGQALGWVRADR
jgi:hypothetical protein